MGVSVKNQNKYRRTKKGVITQIYGSQISRAKLDCSKEVKYTKTELKDWLYSQELFHRLYNDWKNSGFNKSLFPSVDRINDNGCYEISNIQLMTWNDNCLKSYIDKINGLNRKTLRAIIQFSKDAKIVAEYYSINSAERATGIKSRNIGNNLSGRSKSAGGYIWKYADEIFGKAGY